MVDPMAPTPIYIQLADLLETEIRSGALPAGRPIPSEKTLQQEHGVARGTARRAVEVLRDRGVVVTVPQRGTYPADPLPPK